jgi:5-methylcytosine-specific restriction endonuclease McrA
VEREFKAGIHRGEGLTVIRDPVKYEIKEILTKIGKNAPHIRLDNDRINVSSLRLLTFKEHGTTCVHCGLKAEYFVKEKNEKDTVFHLNLYGVNDKGKEILFTKDHIIPKSKGGKEHLSNMQTMCSVCNQKKDNTVPKEKCNEVRVNRLVKCLRLIAPSTVSLILGLVLVYLKCYPVGWMLTGIGAFAVAQYFYWYFHKGMEQFFYVNDI